MKNFRGHQGCTRRVVFEHRGGRMAGMMIEKKKKKK
jgi:hypothetical protein